MSTSSYTSFAVLGAGKIGGPIIAGLAAKPTLCVVVLGRPGSKSLEDLPAGVKVAAVDTTDVAAVAAVLKEHEVEVVVSALSTHAITAQEPIAKAAKEASVKLFVPSEFGFPTDGHKFGPLHEKGKFAELLKSLGVPSLRIFTGAFMQLIPVAFGYAKTQKFTIIGSGEVPVSFTSLADITGFVVYVLTSLAPSQLENKVFRVQGDRTTLNDLAPLFSTTVEHVTELEGPMAAEIKGFMLVADSGAGSTGWNGLEGKEGTGDAAAGSANKLWEGHHWTTIKELFNL
ncbi:NmrA domain-containing protein [Mycena chlorophos]|uniref:NmrA domain-containing protein n=1 Tax=Mycena chlorophos TaxID=658473 RepID=A0A8H6T3N7_MYCCL|nr:NmrA domain-containing protein [Mycena chlorophos]